MKDLGVVEVEEGLVVVEEVEEEEEGDLQQ